MIGKHEHKIRGTWIVEGGKVKADETSQRIEWLKREYLREVTRDSSGWDVLYVDPNDSRMWELTHPQGEMHGGGPPMLRVIGEREAQEKYGIAPPSPHGNWWCG